MEFANSVAEYIYMEIYFRATAVLPVRAFLVSLVSVSLSSPVAFLLLLLPAAVRFAEVVLVGVAWFDVLSTFIKLVEIGVGAVCAGVDCAEAIGDSCFSRIRSVVVLVYSNGNCSQNSV